MTAPDRRPAAVVRLHGPSDVVAAIPHLLGFVPRESVVVVALRGSRGRVGLTMRLDLVGEAHDKAVARLLASSVARHRAAEVVVAVFTDVDDRRGGLPRSGLADAVRESMPVPVRDLLLVRNSRWWSYGCHDVAGRPGGGCAVDPGSAGAVAVAAAHALTGRAVLADRAAVVSSISPVTGAAERSMREAIERAADEFAAGRRRCAAAACALLARLLDRYDEPPARLTDDEAACCVVALHDVGVRDTLIGWGGERPAAAYRLLLDLARSALPPWDAPACTVLACCAYAEGEGVIAAGALDRALRTVPDYSLALLLRSALDRQMHPVELRQAMRQGRVSPDPAS